MSELERALHLAIDQLQSLRVENRVLAARVETMELMAGFLFAKPPERTGGAMAEDAVWLLHKELDKLMPRPASEQYND